MSQTQNPAEFSGRSASRPDPEISAAFCPADHGVPRVSADLQHDGYPDRRLYTRRLIDCGDGCLLIHL